MTKGEDLRTFMRETLLRYDRELAAMEEADKRRSQAARERQAADRARLEEILAEGRAGREALFRRLYRFDGKGGPAAAG